MERLLVFAAVGLVAQFVDGSLGMAYGVTSTTLLLSAGVAPAVASASVHLAECGTTLVSGFSHWRFGNVDWYVVMRIAGPGAVGAFVGATILSNLSTEVAAPWMALLLLGMGLFVLSRFVLRDPPTPHPGARPSPWLLAPLGLFAGFIDATGGGGWGPIATPTLLSSRRTNPRTVIGSVSTAEFVVTVAASLGFLYGLGNEGLDYRVVGGLLIGGVIAAPFAAWLVHRIAAPILGATVGGLIVASNARTLVGSFESLDSRVAAALYGAVLALWLLAVVVAVRKVRARAAGELVRPAR